ncbi:hypothetical protein EIP86_004900 [Pleurotus ostreatoroseus]|nr:hypothetical protein EIP86_004900 [Pleurotus ostreatoroseus]
MSEASAPAARIVPGAPPPAPLTKSQKKKRKAQAMKKTASEQTDAGEHVAVPDAAAAALIDHAPTESDVREGSVAPELVAPPAPEAQATREVSPMPEGGERRVSALVDMLNKRIKTTSKKITRIQSYSTTPVDKLNEDQRRALKTLPILEATVKELEEVKKAIEIHEAEQALEIAARELRAAAEQEQRIQEAVAAAELANLQKTLNLLSIVPLHNALASRAPNAIALSLLEEEAMAVFSAVEAMLNIGAESRSDVVAGLLSGEGELRNVPYSRLHEITDLFLNPPRAPTPPVEEAPVEFIIAEAAPEELEPEPAVLGLPPSLAPAVGSFRFVQEDELAAELEAEIEAQVEAEVEAELEQLQPVEEPPVEVEVEETVTEVNGHTVVEETITVTAPAEVPAAENGALNWADEDNGELPSIASLHDKFGSSATGTPAVVSEPLPPASAPAPPTQPQPEDDGFQAARGRGTYRGGRGHRGGERGAYRGPFRGGDRGERGSYRGGRGAFRGERGAFRGEHGERGGFRGEHGERGPYRARGEWRGHGEGRGRGRGRGM